MSEKRFREIITRLADVFDKHYMLTTVQGIKNALRNISTLQGKAKDLSYSFK